MTLMLRTMRSGILRLDSSPTVSPDLQESSHNTTNSVRSRTLLSGPNLAEYNCPICFSPPTNATLTPCGHVMCGSCLFTAVKTTISRAVGPGASESLVPRCV